MLIISRTCISFATRSLVYLSVPCILLFASVSKYHKLICMSLSGFVSFYLAVKKTEERIEGKNIACGVRMALMRNWGHKITNVIKYKK